MFGAILKKIIIKYMSNEMSVNEVEINGVAYVRKDSVKSGEMAASVDGLKYVIVRTYSAGVFAGYMKERNGKEAKMVNVRRLWYWDGAASLSQLATDGTTKPTSCKFPCEVSEIDLTEVIEVLPVTAKAQKSIASVKVWEM